jgi:pimeloyl-ACP methyl ester carboxylesterase
MTSLVAIGSWVTENESLLSGLAAMIVLFGVVLSPLGMATRRLFRRDADSRDASIPVGYDPARSSDAGPPVAPRLTLKALTAPSIHPTRFATSDGARIAYNERGSGPLALVVAPGILSHLNVMDALPATRGTLDALAGFARVVTFDKRGQGLSDPTLRAPDLEQRSRDIAAVMDAAGLDRAFLLGFSEGGPMCVHFASLHPERVRGLILVGTAARFLQSEAYPIGIPRRALEAVVDGWGRGSLRPVLMPSISREVLDDETYVAMERLIGPRETVRQLIAMMIETDVRSLLPAVRVPAMVLHFTGDLAIPIRLGRALAEGLPKAEFVEVNAVDHGDLSQSTVAIERIRRFCEQADLEADGSAAP